MEQRFLRFAELQKRMRHKDMATSYLNSLEMAERYRAKALDISARKVLMTRFSGTEQEGDLSVPPNCDGYGRIRHFRRTRNLAWPGNPLPIDPALNFLNLPSRDAIEAQVFQNAVCNWRCWYCFVPFNLLDANPKHSSMIRVADLVDLWIRQPQAPSMIDLTGGQPEIVPEWVVWTMEELRDRGLEGKVYLWSDDNLSTDFFWTTLSDEQRDTIKNFTGYGRVCCFKGFDDESFSFNTTAAPDEFALQFARIKRLIDLGIDIYGYATFTCPNVTDIRQKMSLFVDRLRSVDELLPLRVVPLQIESFTPTAARLNILRNQSIDNQTVAVHEWTEILERIYPSELRGRAIHEIQLLESA
jgi:uncharacterized Fe-S cluster-containing radical SAM superfamily protein